MDSIKKDLLKSLECPVCSEIMSPPITLCEKGHNICKICKPTLKKCPKCHGTLLEIRNQAIEDISNTIEHPCKFHKSGCTLKYLLKEKKKHEDVCSYAPHKCPFYIVGKCKWEGTVEKMMEHIGNSHRNARDIRSLRQGKALSSLSGYRIPNFWYQAVVTMDQVFFLHTKSTGDFLYTCCMYVGSKEEGNNRYKFTVTMRSEDGEQIVTSCLKCPYYMDFTKDEYPYGKCAAFHNEFVRECVSKKDILTFEREIFRY